MMSKNMPRATKAEKARNDIILSLHCICCTLSGDFRKRKLECHHIVRGNKRMGHWFTLQLCLGHHKGEWTDQPIRVGISSGRHAFKEAYGYDELELWQRQQVALRLDDTLPPSKIARRLHDIAATDGRLVGVSTGQADLPQAQSCGAGSAVPSDARDAPEGRGDAGRSS